MSHKEVQREPKFYFVLHYGHFLGRESRCREENGLLHNLVCVWQGGSTFYFLKKTDSWVKINMGATQSEKNKITKITKIGVGRFSVRENVSFICFLS